MASEEKWRLFYAVELPEAVRQQAVEVQRRLAAQMGSMVKWVSAENLHVTLKFVGWVPAKRVGRAIEIGRQVAAASVPCDLVVRGAGAFPSPSRPRVIWLGLAGQVEVLAGIATQLDELTAGEGLAEPESRPFTPHLTLGRVRRGKKPRDIGPALAQFEGCEFGNIPVRGFVLMRSHLRPDGPKYEVVDTFELQARQRG